MACLCIKLSDGVSEGHACEQIAEGDSLWHAVQVYIAVMVTVTITRQQICCIHLLLDSASTCGSLCDVTWPKWSLHSNVTCSVSLRCWGSASASILLRTECWDIVGTLAYESFVLKGHLSKKRNGIHIKMLVEKANCEEKKGRERGQ